MTAGRVSLQASTSGLRTGQTLATQPTGISAAGCAALIVVLVAGTVEKARTRVLVHRMFPMNK